MQNLAYLAARIKSVRRNILQMSYDSRSAHTGGALSCVEILVALYFKILHINPQDSENGDRDRLIFSKAHDAKALYAVLAEKGYFPKKILKKYECDGAILPGHSTRNCVPGVEISAGSLGHGLSLAAGIAYAAKIDRKKYRVFAVLSDGECDTGSTWEAALFAGHHKLNNLTAIVDCNKLQGFGYTRDVLNLEPLPDKWISFGWECRRINGHDVRSIIRTLKQVPFNPKKPSIIIADTIKGYGGVPCHINQISSQYKPPTREELELALKKLK